MSKESKDRFRLDKNTQYSDKSNAKDVEHETNEKNLYNKSIDYGADSKIVNGVSRIVNPVTNHWSTSEYGSLVARATAFIYRVIIAPRYEGGLKEFFEENCLIFEDFDEHKLQYMEIYKEYERLLDERLDNFAEMECSSVSQILEGLSIAADQDRGASKHLDHLLAATDYNKFVKLMRSKAKEMRDRIATEGLPEDNRQPALRSHPIIQLAEDRQRRAAGKDQKEDFDEKKSSTTVASLSPADDTKKRNR